MNYFDIVGKRFGKLLVENYLGFEQRGKYKYPVYDCKCDCGKHHVKATRSCLLSGDKKSCGCAHKDAASANFEDLTGKRFGRWTVLEHRGYRYSKSGKSRSTMWLCKCDCGTIKEVRGRALKTGASTSCGCYQKERIRESLSDNLIGQRFGMLTVIGREAQEKRAGWLWRCKCDCGNELLVPGFSLKNGDNSSCGCRKSSKYEDYVEEYLKSCGYIRGETYFREKTFPDLFGVGGGKLKYDFYVCLHSGEHVLIECQGQQHYKSFDWFGGDSYFEKLQKHDKLKKEYAENNNYRLIEVDYTKVLYEDVVNVLKLQLVI